MKQNQILGTLWIIIALYDLVLGIQFIYKYSNPMMLWLYMVPTWITFTKIFTGILGIIIGLGIWRKGNHKLILPFTTLLIIFIIFDFIKIGFEFLNDAGSNLILLLLAVLTIKITDEFEPKIFKEPRILILIAIGLMPYILNHWISYDWFNFLH